MVTTAYRDAWSAVQPDIDRWLKVARGPYSPDTATLFARIQADIGDAIRDALDADPNVTAFIREGIVLDTLARFRKAAALVGTPASDDIIRAQMQRALGTGAARAQTVVTTMDLQRTRQSKLDAIAGSWTWRANLDRRTCAYCLSMHGTEHAAGTAMLSHPNCRCMPVPDAIAQTGWTWLRRQTVKVQDRILHPLVGRAWRAGRLAPEAIVDPSKMRRRPLRELMPHLVRTTAYRADRRRR